MADKILPDKLTKENLAGILRDLEPGTLLVGRNADSVPSSFCK